jgi:hypothetical protein
MHITIKLFDTDCAEVGSAILEIDSSEDVPAIVKYHGTYYERVQHHPDYYYRQAKMRTIINLNKA